MALSFHPTTAPLFGHHRLPAADDMSFLQDVHPEVTDALLGFVYDPVDPALDDLLNLPPPPVVDDAAAAILVPTAHAQHCAKKPRACSLLGVEDAGHPQRNGGGGSSQQAPGPLLEKFVLPLPLPLPPPPSQQLVFVRGGGGADDAKKSTGGGACQSVQSAAARQRRKRISEKTAELSRLIPGGHKMNTAEMLEEAARHVKLLQAQVGVLALMRNEEDDEEEMPMPSMAQEQMHALLVRGRVQERLAAAGRCLVPTKLVHAVAKDRAVVSNAAVSRDLGRFVASLQALGQ